MNDENDFSDPVHGMNQQEYEAHSAAHMKFQNWLSRYHDREIIVNRNEFVNVLIDACGRNHDDRALSALCDQGLVRLKNAYISAPDRMTEYVRREGELNWGLLHRFVGMRNQWLVWVTFLRMKHEGGREEA